MRPTLWRNSDQKLDQAHEKWYFVIDKHFCCKFPCSNCAFCVSICRQRRRFIDEVPRGRELVSSQGLCCGAPGCRRPTEPAVQAQAAARAVAAHETGSSGSGHRRSRFSGQLDARQLRRHNYKSSVLPAKSSAHLEHRSRTRASRPGMNMGQKISGK